MRLVVLDTEAAQDTSGPLDDGVATAALTEAQSAWLDEQLRAAGDRWVVVAAHRRLDEAVLARLAGSPRVVAVLNGDTHRASIEPYRAPGGPASGGSARGRSPTGPSRRG